MAEPKNKKDDTSTASAPTPTVVRRLAPQVVPVQSLKGTLVVEHQAVVDAEHYFLNQGKNVTWLIVTAGATAVDVTISGRRDVANAVYTVAANSSLHIGPFAPDAYNNHLNEIWLDFSHQENVTVAVCRIGQ